jgi:hypothetical protein
VATHRAIDAVCQGVIDLLRDNYAPADFNQELDFRVYGAANFAAHMTSGVSLFLYRVYIDGVRRLPPGRIASDGTRAHPMLPVDLHFILTPWGKDVSTLHAITGWVMRTIEDTPVLPSGLLNRRVPGVFRSDEAVELTIGDIATEQLLHLWELIGPASYRLSVPYVARNVRIESERVDDSGALVQERVSRFRELIAGEAS